MLSGLLFGCGYILIFIAMFNYLTDAYEQFAASALGVSSTTRSIFGAVLPFAAGPMYKNLGIHWASSLIGFVSLVSAIIPFVFIKYGERIREGSRFCRELKEKKRAMMEEEERQDREKQRIQGMVTAPARTTAAAIPNHHESKVGEESAVEARTRNASNASEKTISEETVREKSPKKHDSVVADVDIERVAQA